MEHAQFSVFVAAVAALPLEREETEHLPLSCLGPNERCAIICSLVSFQRSGSEQEHFLRLKPKAVELLICTTPLLV